jgi:Ribosomal protein S14p/S29e
MCINWTGTGNYARLSVPNNLDITDDRMNRIKFRDMALAGELPGVQKASW